jgi:hypothetical protein
MKKILLSLMFVNLLLTSYSQTPNPFPCPSTYKSNSGGGGCDSKFTCVGNPNSVLTASIIVTYAFAPSSVPQLISVKELKDNTNFVFQCVTGEFVKNTNNLSIRYCFYGVASNDNWFNSKGNLSLEIKYADAPSNQICTVVPPEQSPLPVHFKSFNASRTATTNVSITWTTASEQNSRGFNVQKNVGGEWKTIAFVPSQAQGGNSTYDLNYSFKDANNEKGITQYRVQQVDLDGKFAYTDIRAIRGEGTLGKIVVYPNPSVDGKVNVVFEDNTVRDIQVNDMQGKIIRSYRGITNNILVIEKLTSGFYTIKITNRNTTASSVEKVVVK